MGFLHYLLPGSQEVSYISTTLFYFTFYSSPQWQDVYLQLQVSSFLRQIFFFRTESKRLSCGKQGSSEKLENNSLGLLSFDAPWASFRVGPMYWSCSCWDEFKILIKESVAGMWVELFPFWSPVKAEFCKFCPVLSCAKRRCSFAGEPLTAPYWLPNQSHSHLIISMTLTLTPWLLYFGLLWMAFIIKYSILRPRKCCFLPIKMQRFQPFEEIIMKKDSCSYTMYVWPVL